MTGGGSVTLAALSLIPPPFPFTPFVLAAGALEVRRATFFTTFTACRLLRFGLEAALAVRFGRGILQWLDSDIFQTVVTCCIVLAVALTTVSIVRAVRSTRTSPVPSTLVLVPRLQTAQSLGTIRIRMSLSVGNVLIVEDDRDTRELLATMLSTEGFHAVVAEDGLEALHLLRTVRHRAPDVPCLVLLDLAMPRLGGPEFRRAQLSDPTCRQRAHRCDVRLE